MPITLKETLNITITNSFNNRGQKDEPLKKEKEKLKVIEIKTKSKKVLRKNG